MGILNIFNKKKEKNSNVTDIRLGFVLLDSKDIDWNMFIKNLANDWSICISEKPTENGQLVFEVDGMMVACGFVETVIPNDEAVNNAKNNFLWKEAVQVTKLHKAHIMLTIMHGDSAINKSLIFTKIASSLLKLNNAIALYQWPTVYQPDFYIKTAEDINEGALPILDWVYFGVYPDGDKFSGYTVGLDYFGKDEIEVIKSKESPDELYVFLIDIADYIITTNVTLKHGETIGFTEEQKLKIIRSKGIAVEKESIKIGF